MLGEESGVISVEEFEVISGYFLELLTVEFLPEESELNPEEDSRMEESAGVSEDSFPESWTLFSVNSIIRELLKASQTPDFCPKERETSDKTGEVDLEEFEDKEDDESNWDSRDEEDTDDEEDDKFVDSWDEDEHVDEVVSKDEEESDDKYKNTLEKVGSVDMEAVDWSADLQCKLIPVSVDKL